MPRNLVVLAALGLVVYCLFDVFRAPANERFGLHPLVWVALIVLFPLVGSVVWLVASRSRRDTGRRPAAPSGPDDDPEFLRSLEQRQPPEHDADDGARG